jgi:RNA polymerase sigma factor (sigma-70 family)
VPTGSGGHRSEFGEAFEALIAAARAGAPWAWERLHGWLAGPVAGYLRVQGARDVDDLTSDVWLGVFRGIASFQGSESQFRSWVFVIAHHRLVDQRRRLGRDLSVAVDEVPEQRATAAAEDEALVRLARERVEAVIARLAPDQRDVLLLRIVADLTIEQIAEALGKSEGAVKALQRRGLAAVRRILADEGVPL